MCLYPGMERGIPRNALVSHWTHVRRSEVHVRSRCLPACGDNAINTFALLQCVQCCPATSALPSNANNPNQGRCGRRHQDSIGAAIYVVLSSRSSGELRDKVLVRCRVCRCRGAAPTGFQATPVEAQGCHGTGGGLAQAPGWDRCSACERT